VSELKYSEKVHISFTKGDRKRVKRNDKEYDRLADHIGEFPLVMISPSDANLIYGGSEDRRKYIDGVISQFDRAYLNTILHYNKVLQQRNALLRNLSDNANLDNSILEIIDNKLCEYGNEIHSKRKAFLEDFIPLIQTYYEFISNDKEKAGIKYKSQLTEADFCNLLRNNYKKDLALKHSSVGTHRDDLNFELNGFPIKKFGSQGQQKSFLISLKIAQFEYTYKKKKYKPLLLLDDIFDKLDFNRVQQLMKLVSRNEFGQIFITDTNQERIKNIFKEIEVERNFFMVNEGNIEIINTNE
jgi:DNA replication and repair protein RecF